MSAPPANARHPLTPHPSSPPVPVRGISVSATRDDGYLVMAYRLVGNLDALLLPAPREPARADELWRHTCFEAFVGRVASTEYCEYNFSPSGQWAAYHFSAYRAGMRPQEPGIGPPCSTRITADTLELKATVDMRWLTPSRGGTIRLGVTAVIEDRAGVLSYWALKHPAEKPDFHLSDSFVIDVL